MVYDFLDVSMPKTRYQVGGQASECADVRCVIGSLPLAIQTNAVIEEALVRVPGGLSANGKLLSCGGNSECKLGLPESSSATSLVLASAPGAPSRARRLCHRRTAARAGRESPARHPGQRRCAHSTPSILRWTGSGSIALRHAPLHHSTQNPTLRHRRLEL